MDLWYTNTQPARLASLPISLFVDHSLLFVYVIQWLLPHVLGNFACLSEEVMRGWRKC